MAKTRRLTKKKIKQISRSEVRYHLYRIRTFFETGRPHQSEKFKEFYEKQIGFTNWLEFARIWDLDEEGKHYRIIRRARTEEEEWENEVTPYLEVLPLG